MTETKFLIPTPWPTWRLLIGAGSDHVLQRVQFVPVSPPLAHDASPCPLHIAREFQRYFADPRYRIELPLAPQGSSFDREVRDILRGIPVGQTLSYGAIAARIGSAPRAVGGACRRNPYHLVVPCHRVVSRSGLGGFVGAGDGAWPWLKSRLLAHERANLVAA